jgi:hypothetical protein
VLEQEETWQMAIESSRAVWVTLIAGALWPSSAAPASANFVVPLLYLVWPAAWVLLLPIILFEARAAVRVLRLHFTARLKVAAGANLVSTALAIPDGRGPTIRASPQRRTALMRAARRDRAGTVQALVERGAEVQAKDAEGKTASMCAAGEGNTDIVQLLARLERR